jgi:hypothetical protein
MRFLAWHVDYLKCHITERGRSPLGNVRLSALQATTAAIQADPAAGKKTNRVERIWKRANPSSPLA